MSDSRPRAGDPLAGGVSLDLLFRSTARSRPDAPALADPADRAQFTDGEPRQLSYAQADAAVGRLAGRLRALGLPERSAVAMQLPNTIEAPIALLAILRAGMVAVPVPMAWRRAELVAALEPVGAKALVTLARFGDDRPAEIACEAAAELFGLSFPCAFGAAPPDGVIPLEIDASVEKTPQVSASARSDAIAIATFDATRHGFVAVARTHAQWLACGLATLLEARIENGDTILSTLPPASLGGLGGAFVPWLLSGGTLAAALGPAAANMRGPRHLVAPATALAPFAQTAAEPFASCIAVHRAPDRTRIDFSRTPGGTFADLHCFGETGLVALRRDDAAWPRPIPLGPISAPSSMTSGPTVIETRMREGELVLAGPAVSSAAFPGDADGARIPIDGEGFVRTGYRCRAQGTRALVPVAGPPGVAVVGGLRFGLEDLARRVATAVPGAMVGSIDDPLLGARLRIEADDSAAAKAALEAAGHSRLLVEAVVPRQTRRRAAG